ncbi:MAG TPA: serine protease [Dehalococcoidia bacterium]|nr:serine protease [Dehalococcoidia bacterium]
MSVSTWLIIIIVVFIAAFLFIAIYWGIRAHRNRIAAGREDLVGRTASVEVALEPKGIVLVDGERWTAVIENGSAEPEEEVIVSKVEGLRLIVTKKNK